MPMIIVRITVFFDCLLSAIFTPFTLQTKVSAYDIKPDYSNGLCRMAYESLPTKFKGQIPFSAGSSYSVTILQFPIIDEFHTVNLYSYYIPPYQDNNTLIWRPVKSVSTSVKLVLYCSK